MEMILAGECGTFNPLLLECLKDIAGNIPVEMAKAAEQPTYPQGSQCREAALKEAIELKKITGDF